jgi:hypothetical protein
MKTILNEIVRRHLRYVLAACFSRDVTSRLKLELDEIEAGRNQPLGGGCISDGPYASSKLACR